MADKQKAKLADDVAGELRADPTADFEARRQQRRDDLEAQLRDEERLTSVPQKVLDPNESAAIRTLSDRPPYRDMSEAPEPGQLGPHSETLNPVADPADVNTSVAGNEEQAKGDKPAK